MVFSNPVFLSAGHGTVTAMRRAFFGEQFWRDFTSSAKKFNEATQKEIFRSPQVLNFHWQRPQSSCVLRWSGVVYRHTRCSSTTEEGAGRTDQRLVRLVRYYSNPFNAAGELHFP